MTDNQSDPTPSDDCCVDPRIPEYFDAKSRQRSAGGVLPPMRAVTERLFDQLKDAEQIKPTLLELGCGTGALAVALLTLGAARADGIDLSPVSVATARRRADAAGVSDRVTFEVGDGAQVAVTKHDWVVLDRVICCYPDVDGLLANAVPAAGSRFIFAVPNSRGWRGVVSKILIKLDFLLTKLQRNGCPSYVHSLDKIEGKLQAAGFSLRSRTNGFWYTAVWERPAEA